MERHIKRTQFMVVVSSAVLLVVSVMVFSMLTLQISDLNDRLHSISSEVNQLDKQSKQQFVELGRNITSLSRDITENSQGINITNTLMQTLGVEIKEVSEESKSGIQSIRSELNYTGTIDKALESVVLIMWTDKKSVVGSGFLVSGDGYLLTANHVVEKFDGKTIRVKDRVGNLFIASVEGRNTDIDVALLKIRANNASYLELGDSDNIRLGSKVFALGAPEGFSFSASEGILSALRSVRDIKDNVGLDLDLAPSTYVVQTDAAITHGNSGGPLIDTSGEVIGLNSFGISRESSGVYQDIEGLNFAISSNDIRSAYGDSMAG